jgi:cytochrome c peroxidase
MTAAQSWPALIVAGILPFFIAPAAYAQDKSYDWLLPKAGVGKQTPIVFVSQKSPAEWNKLTRFWNPTVVDFENPITGQKGTRWIVKVKLPLGITEPPPVPLENMMTAERWDLGRKLYFDPILSADQKVSCATCHNPKLGFTDQLPVSAGIGGLKGGVSAPTVINSAYNPLQFWDGRAASLEEQAQGPVGNPIEMFNGKGEAWPEAVKRLRQDSEYVKQFVTAYGHEPTRDAAAKAIATYERTVISGNSVHDRAEQAMRTRVTEDESGKFELQPKDYEKALQEASAKGDKGALAPLKLDDKKADLAAAAKSINEGRVLFFGKARCNLCHVGQNFSDGSFHNLGVGVKDGKLPADSFGRFAQLPTGHKNPDFIGAFKTPPLRALSSTGPFMHTGAERSLEAVIDFYDRGGNANEFLSPKMRDLDAEKAFVRAKQSGGKYDGREVKLFGDTPIAPFTLKLTPQEKMSLVMFLRALEGEVDPLVSDPRIPAMVK